MSPQPNPALLNLADPRSVAVYDTYEDAQKAVDYLADHQFPVERLAIVGTDLKSIERVTGRLTWGKVLLSGTAGGVMWGLALAVLLWIFVPGHSLPSYLVWGLLFGVLYGVLAAAVQYAMTRGQRDFSSAKAVIATHYEVLGESDVFQKARSLLGENPTAWRVPADTTGVQPVVKDAPSTVTPPVTATPSVAVTPSTVMSRPAPIAIPVASASAASTVTTADAPKVTTPDAPKVASPAPATVPTIPVPDATLYPHLAAALGAKAAELPERFRIDRDKDDTDPHGIGPVKPADSPTFVGKLDLGQARPPQPSGPRRAG